MLVCRKKRPCLAGGDGPSGRPIELNPQLSEARRPGIGFDVLGRRCCTEKIGIDISLQVCAPAAPWTSSETPSCARFRGTRSGLHSTIHSAELPNSCSQCLRFRCEYGPAWILPGNRRESK